VQVIEHLIDVFLAAIPNSSTKAQTQRSIASLDRRFVGIVLRVQEIEPELALHGPRHLGIRLAI
jgi:hypothetical protein